MASHNTAPELSRLVAEYLRGGGQRTFARMRVPRELKELGRTQDRIGWRNFTEGKITKCFCAVQRRFLKASGASLTVDSWLKAFVSKLLGMTHSMWIFRCISKHHRTKGKLVLDTKAKIFKEIERQLAMGEEAIAKEDKWMLEVDTTELRDSSLEE